MNHPPHAGSCSDIDGSGTVDLRELDAAISFILDPNADSALENLMMLDAEGLGSSIRQLRRMLASQAARVMDLFRRWDSDKNGMISRDEFKRAILCSPWACAVRPHELDGLFGAHDPAF